MRIARFWAKGHAEGKLPNGKVIPLAIWGWSETSLEEARKKAKVAAQRVARRLESRETPSHSYGYVDADRPAREEIVREISAKTGAESSEIIATITRNAYGALVLNTTQLVFIDVDIPMENLAQSFTRKVRGWFGQKLEAPEMRIQSQIEKAIDENSQHTFRLYRTAAGFRCVILDKPIPADSVESRKLLESFGADPLYIKICRSQNCYRARLTPKFWRCGSARPPHRFPFETAQHEGEMRRWQEEYQQASAPFAVCRFVKQYGNRVDDELKDLLDLHDGYSRAASLAPLA